jgi:hypothetical protein
VEVKAKDEAARDGTIGVEMRVVKELEKGH